MLRTDHSALKQLLANLGRDVQKSSKFVWWAGRLSAFDYKPQYRRGCENTIADTLSHLPAPTNGPAIDNPGEQLICKRLSAEGLPLSNVMCTTTEDPTLQKVIHHIQTTWPYQKDTPCKLQPFYSIHEELSVESGCLICENDRIAVPVSLQKWLLQLAHVGHPGTMQMKRHLRTMFWWPGLSKECEHMVRHCQACQASMKLAAPAGVLPTKIEHPSEPWCWVGLDITRPYDVAPTIQQFIVTIADHHSHYPECLLTNDITSSQIIHWLKDIFARYGNPTQLVTDNGPQFVSETFTTFLKDHDIQHLCTANYNLQENAAIETFNKTLKHAAQAFSPEMTMWEVGVHNLLMIYHTTLASPNGLSPTELLLGHKIHASFQPVLQKFKKGRIVSLLSPTAAIAACLWLQIRHCPLW